MGKRIYEIAEELGVKSQQILSRLSEIGVVVPPGQKPHLISLTPEQEAKVRELFKTAPREGELEVKRLGTTVVRRRAVGAPPKTGEPQKPVPEVKAPQPQRPKVEERPVAVQKEPPVEPPPLKEQPKVEEPPKVEQVVVEEAKPKETLIKPAPEPEAQSEVVEEKVSPEAVSHPQPQPEVIEPEEKPKPASPKKKASLVALKPEVPERRAKLKRLIYDRKREIISLRDLLSGEDEIEYVPPREPVRRKKQVQRGKKVKPTPITQPKEQKRVIRVEGEAIQVAELARHMGVKAADVIKKLMSMGVMASATQPIDLDTAGIVAAEFGYSVEKVGFDPAEILKEPPDPPESLVPRPPVVTIMGHVDHGKTTLLDRIRRSRIAESEAGGITQHIGAYKVSVPNGDIVFLDTPGHEAFTAMRARGASVTDIVVLVVAADDGVKAQTLEAIAHARDAKAPIIVAINKIDKPEANVERVKRELAEQGLIPEEWGGQTIFCEISAKKGIGIENLLEMILLQASIMDLKANPSKPGRGVVLEAMLDKQVGPLATVLVQAGTLRTGDVVIAGLAHGRIRRMVDDMGNVIEEAKPVTPVQVAGLNLVPNAGDQFVVVPDERKAKEIAEWQMEQLKIARTAKAQSRVTLADFYKMAQSGGTKELKVILRADVQGSLGAIVDALGKLKHPEIKLNIIHSAVGNITESDVHLAMAANAVIVGFDVGIEPKAYALATQEKIDVRRYSVIYELIDDVRKAMEGLLQPKKVARLAGKAEVRQVFNISKVGRVAGCYVSFGRVLRSADVKVLRGKEVIYEGRIASLKHFKDDVREVKQGMECGIAIEGFENVEVGDTLEFYEYETVTEQISVEGA